MPGRVKSHAHARQKKRRKIATENLQAHSDPIPRQEAERRPPEQRRREGSFAKQTGDA